MADSFHYNLRTRKRRAKSVPLQCKS